jgi:hypothetical protein
MNLKSSLRKITEFTIVFTAITLLAIAGCGGGGGSGGGSPPPTVTVSTFAGSTTGAVGYNNGFGTAARFQTPSFITSDGTNLYVTDWNANNIRKIVIATGEVTTFAGSITGLSGVADTTTGPGTNAMFYQPNGITTDGSNLYVANSGSNNIKQINILTGVVTTIAGSTTGSSGTQDAAGTSARFSYPYGISKIGNNLYVTDFQNSTIRKIDLSAGADVTTLAGTPAVFAWNNNLAGASAAFNCPTGLSTDGTNLFATEALNHDVRKIDPSTRMTTLVAGGNYLLSNSGIGSTDAIGMDARFNDPRGITTDGTNLYVADTFNNSIRKIVINTGFVSTLAGMAGVSGMRDADGPTARFNRPMGIFYINGTLYVADYLNGSIRKIQL